MSQRDNKQSNRPDDLAEVKSLIGDADGVGYELDDILAEFGGTPKGVTGGLRIQASQHNVIAFPGLSPEDATAYEEEDDGEATAEESLSPDEAENSPCNDGSEPPAPPAEDEPPLPSERELITRTPRPAPVIPFPGEPEPEPSEKEENEGSISSFFKDINRRADDYADRMYEEDERLDPEQVRRLEKLIPGTDVEEEPPVPPPSKKEKKKAPPPPDTPPQELARIYTRGLNSLRIRQVLLLVLFALAFVQLLVPALGYVFVQPLGDPLVQHYIAAGLMGAGALLGYDVILSGFISPFRGKFGMETFSALASLFTLADAVILTMNASQRMPFTAPALAGLYFLLLGRYHNQCAHRLSCRTAAASSSPYRVTLDEGKWNGRDTYCKWSGDTAGFGSQIQQENGPQFLYRCFCPFVLLASVLFTGYTAFTVPENALWSASAVFTAVTALGAGIPYGRAFHLVSRRLAHVGAALAGWPGIIGSRRADRVLITDTDLFPPGYVELNGFKVLGDFPMERVVAYTATMIRDSGSGLTKLFHDYLRTLGGLMRNSQNLCCYEGGGLSATIRGNQVLVGSAAFMNLMEIPLPPGLNVKNAVFCAIDGELAGIFALNYFLPDAVFPSLDAIIREKVGPVLATRDFNLIPAMLQQRFKLAADRMDFPPVERRRELSSPDQPHGSILAAVLCREGLAPFAESVVCAKRLRRCARLGAVLCCVSSLLGLVLSTYLVSVSAFGSLSPLNLLLYLLIWLAPVWLLSAWTHRF